MTNMHSIFKLSRIIRKLTPLKFESKENDWYIDAVGEMILRYVSDHIAKKTSYAR